MNQVDGWKWRTGLATALVMMMALPAWAQLQPRRDPQRMMADQLRLLMQQSLAGQDAAPTPAQLTQAQILLNLALDLAPQDADLWRAQREIAQWRGDQKRGREALAQIVKLEPENDAAQLDWIMGSVAQEQTLDRRLAAVSRILDAPASRSLSTSLRSRLASYAAVASREMGDADAFARRLAQAIKLDPTNADAARIMYELAAQRSGTADVALYRGTALIGWVAAAPADVQARFLLGELLLRQAAFEEAAKQFEMSVALSMGPPEPTQLRLWVTALAMAGQVDAALGVLDQVEQVTAAGPGDSAKPTMAAELALVRAAIQSVGPRGDGAGASFERLRTSLTALTDSGSEAAARELAVATALFSDDLEAALRLAEGESVDAATRDVVRGWVALRYGRTQEGRTLLRPLAQDNDLAALGLALLEEDVEAQASMLETIRRRDPIGVAGLLAVLNLRKSDRVTPPTRIGMALRDRMTRSSARLWHADLAYSPWLSMRLRVEPMRPGYLDPLQATATLHNLSGAPLSLAADGGIPARMLVTLSTRDGEGVQRSLPPMVVDIGRRLTVQEGERLAVNFRLDRGALGELLAENPAAPLTIEAAVMVDPRTTASGAVRAGPIGAMDRIRAVQVVNVPATEPNITAWLDGLDSPDAAQQLRSLARLLRALADPSAADVQPRRSEIGDAIASRWERFDHLQRAWVMRFLPPQTQRPDGLKRVVDLAQRSDDAMVRVVHLAAQVDDPASPAMSAALRHTDPTIGEFARALRETLEK